MSDASRARIRRARAVETVAKAVTGAIALGIIALALFIVGYILWRGGRFVTWDFINELPKKQMTEGGIYPVIMGTLYLVLGTALFALPVGIAAGVYLSEYAARNVFTRVVRLAIANMAGVPSVVYGLFGFALFVVQLKLGVSVLSGALTLACVTLPVIITSTEEALRQIPQEVRQASLALGATRLRTIQKVVLPAAAPGIVTGSILGLSRAAGETAPILFTAVAFYAPLPGSPFDKVMALPYHLYIMATQAVKPADHVVWGTAVVLVGGVSIINVIAATWRSRRRRRIRW